VIPDFDLPAPENLEGERVVWTVSDARIDQEVEKAQEHFGEWTPLKRRKKSRDKDQVTIDLKTYQDGEVVDELTNPEFQLKIGDPENIAPLEKAIKGLKVGESFDLECDLSKIDADDSDDSEENIVHFVGEVLNIEEQTPAPIETLFESFSVENEEELREELKKSLITYQTQVSDRELHDSVVEQLVNSEIEIPAPIVERIAHKQLHQNHHHKEGESCDHESSPEQLEEASAQVIRDLKLEAIIHRHKKEHQIEVTESEFNSKLISMLQNAGEIAMQLFQFYQMPEYQARLKQTLLDEKVINHYIELANLPEVERVIEVKEAE
jgi:FKBP-type peptidyl-prolyl cis-trans isomerase (trigger factor)